MALHAQNQSRTTSARRTLVSLLLIPILSLVGLWAFTASVTFGNVIRNEHYNTFTNTTAPGIIGLEATMQAERALTVAWLSTDRHSAQQRTQLLAARRATDTTATAFRAATASVRGLLSTTGQGQLDNFLTSLAGLPRVRAAADAGTDSPVTAYTAYEAIDTAEFGFFRNSVPPDDATLSLMVQASLAQFSAEDSTGGANALLAGALAAHGHMPQAERTLFAQVVAEQNAGNGVALSLATPELAVLFRQVFDSPAYRQLLATQNKVIGSPVGSPVPVSAAAFQASTRAVQSTIGTVQPQIGVALAAQAASLSDSLKTELYLAAGLGLLAVIASVFVAVRFGRRLRLELTGLYDSARQMAEERLPRLVDRLRRGDDVDAAAESPPLKTGRITEIANVARAFTAVQRTAVEAAVGQAELRKGVNQVFVSLSLRNQSLLHRQLGMLDEMERGTSDPVVLGDLFRLDHLTTRLRRHAEGLLILAGSTPGRGWRDPVPAAEVMNAAVAEVEDYVRVDVVTDSTDAVTGTAVNDVIHMLAELIENATVFSPPNTQVEVRGDRVGHGFAIEIEDRGLGMPAELLNTLNARLAAPPEFDLANSDQLGLFVAARLAQRHGIKLSLRPSPFGGTTAIVLLPLSIIANDQPGWTPGAADSARGMEQATAAEIPTAFGLTGRHRRETPQPAREQSAPLLALTPAPEPSPWFGPGQAGSGGEVSDPQFPDFPSRQPEVADFPSRQPEVADFPSRQPELTVVAKDGSRPGLPRRSRGTNLSPHLQATRGAAPAPPAPDEDWPDRSPEDAGTLMSDLQGGWERARMAHSDDFDGED